MNIVDKSSLVKKFNKNIYEKESYLFVTSGDFWDGGIDAVASLEEKAKFYKLASEMSEVFKNFVSFMNEKIYVADFLCEHEKMYAAWSDRNKLELFRAVSKIFRKNKCYEFSLSKEDSEIIDLLIESNFKYYSYFSFFLPKANVIIQPTCHTELIVYSDNLEYTKSILTKIAEPFNNINIKFN